MMRMRRMRRAILAVAVIGLLPAACNRDGDGPKTATREGIVKSINLANREVVMMTKKKSGEEVPMPGTFTDETVVIINGRQMTIKDVREGDKVKVEGRKEGEGAAAQLIATRVEITRMDGDWQDTGKSARAGAADSAKADSND